MTSYIFLGYYGGERGVAKKPRQEERHKIGNKQTDIPLSPALAYVTRSRKMGPSHKSLFMAMGANTVVDLIMRHLNYASKLYS